MGEYEEKLRDLAEGDPWTAPGIGALIEALGKQQSEVQRSIAALPQHWKGQSGDTLLARLKVHANNLGYLQERLYKAQQQITGSGQYSCSLESDNQDRVQQAQAALNSLPSSFIPQGVLDAVNQGAKTVEVAGVGIVKVGAQTLGWVTGQLLSGREAAAKDAFLEIDSVIDAWSKDLKRGAVRFDPIPEFGKAPTPVPPLVYDTGSMPGGNFGGPGAGSGFGNLSGAGGGAGYPTYPGGSGSGPGYGNPGGGIPNPGTPGTPPGTGGPGTGGPGTGGPGDGGGGGSNPGGGDGGYGPGDRYPTPQRPAGPAVDGGLDSGQTGLGMRSGLGAAGLGAAGLAAGAKLASGAGAGGLGAGAGGFGVGGPGGAGTAGLGGTTGTGSAGAGAGNSGSNAAKGAGAGAGRQGMMMGGQGGGAADKKGGANRLGYVAPKFEDDYEESMPHPASRAGKRGE